MKKKFNEIICQVRFKNNFSSPPRVIYMLHIFRSNDFLDLGLEVITVRKSTEKRFRATTLDFKDKYTHELHTLCCSRSYNSASGEATRSPSSKGPHGKRPPVEQDATFGLTSQCHAIRNWCCYAADSSNLCASVEDIHQACRGLACSRGQM